MGSRLDEFYFLGISGALLLIPGAIPAAGPLLIALYRTLSDTVMTEERTREEISILASWAHLDAPLDAEGAAAAPPRAAACAACGQR